MKPLAVGVGPAEVIVAEAAAAAVPLLVAVTLFPAVVTPAVTDTPAEDPLPTGSVKLADELVLATVAALDLTTLLAPDDGAGTGPGADVLKLEEETTELRDAEELGAVVLVAEAEEIAGALELEEVSPLRPLLVLDI